MAPKGYYFCSGDSDGLLYLWATNKPIPLKKFDGHTEEISCLKISKNMIYIVSASYDNSIIIWSIDDGDECRKLYNPFTVLELEIDEVGETLITGDTEGHIIVWNIEKACKINVLEFKTMITGNNFIRGINLAFDESVLLVHSKDKLAFYDFRLVKTEMSKNVFEKYKHSTDKEKSLKVKPFKSYCDSSYDIIHAMFNWRNICVVTMKNL